jgi:hypothetical protein
MSRQVAAAGNRRQVVELVQQPFHRQGLQNSQIEGGAADAAARKGQPDQVVSVSLGSDTALLP